jgi:hypothetical protein
VEIEFIEFRPSENVESLSLSISNMNLAREFKLSKLSASDTSSGSSTVRRSMLSFRDCLDCLDCQPLWLTGFRRWSSTSDSPSIDVAFDTGRLGILLFTDSSREGTDVFPFVAERRYWSDEA